MIREFCTQVGRTYKISLNFRTHKIRVWVYYHNSWVKHLISGVLTKKEILQVAYEMTADDFYKFLRTDNFTLWTEKNYLFAKKKRK